LGYVFEAIRRTRLALQGRVPLFGFVGAPFTLMAYAVEGGGSKTYAKVKSFLYNHPEASHKLLQTFTDVCVEFLLEQVRAGAQLAQVFDSWAGELSPADFKTFALPYLKQIATRVRAGLPSVTSAYVPLVVFARGAHYALNDLNSSGFDVVSLDWTMTAPVARQQCQLTLQGNLDPCLLFAPEQKLRQEIRGMIDSFGTSKYIVNLGHGMLPEHKPEAVAILVDEVHSYSKKLIAEQKQ
jgi:uroporphyrinogen decarboxylase